MWLYLRKGIALAVGVGAFALAVLVIVHATTYASPETTASVPLPTMATDTPERLSIPSISVDAPIEQAGIVAGNRMQAPRKFDEAAWYAYGVVPGQGGDAVIAGHKDNGLGLDGVFAHLDRIEIGDQITVQMQSGLSVVFTVTATSTAPYDEAPSGLFTAKGVPRISLITCAGDWLNSSSEGMTYDRRLIVTAVMNE